MSDTTTGRGKKARDCNRRLKAPRGYYYRVVIEPSGFGRLVPCRIEPKPLETPHD